MSSFQLDLLFILDLTGSQDPYIASAKQCVETICDHILRSNKVKSPEDLRFGLIAFRDHPPMDFTFVTRKWDFTSNINEMLGYLKGLPRPSGGGDGPEAIAAALADALTMPWRADCNKIVVLISDAPPHGIGSEGDFFPDGVPDDQDPLVLAREMVFRGIILHFVACEPVLSSQTNATDFYRGLTRITSGIVIPLLSADQLGPCIIGSALESLAVEQLMQEYASVMDEQLGKQQSPAMVVAYLYRLLQERKQQVTQLHVQDIYRSTPESVRNVATWAAAKNISTARSLLGKKAEGSPFIKPVARKFEPTSQVRVSIRNLTNDHIKVTLLDKHGKIKRGDDGRTAELNESIPPTAIRDIWLEVHVPHRFRFQRGRMLKEDERPFTRNQDYDLAMFFP